MLWLGTACREGASPAVIGRAAATHLCSALKPRKPQPKGPRGEEPLEEMRAALSGPCRPPTDWPDLEPHWLTDTALVIRAGLIRTKQVDGFGILADALQEAGCDWNEGLRHLRAPVGEHRRNCWVFEWLLGSSFRKAEACLFSVAAHAPAVLSPSPPE